MVENHRIAVGISMLSIVVPEKNCFKQNCFQQNDRIAERVIEFKIEEKNG